MVSENEEEFIELILGICDRVLDQDTFRFMMEEGVPVEDLTHISGDYDLEEVLDSLEDKGLAYTESQRETIRSTQLRDSETGTISWEPPEFKTVDCEYVYFTEKLKALYKT